MSWIFWQIVSLAILFDAVDATPLASLVAALIVSPATGRPVLPRPESRTKCRSQIPQPIVDIGDHDDGDAPLGLVAAGTRLDFPMNMTLVHDFFMRVALREADIAWKLHDEVPIGAVLVRNVTGVSNHSTIQNDAPSVWSFQVVALGRNQVEELRDGTAHAEMMALRLAATTSSTNWRLTDTCLYSTVEPCVMCIAALQLCRVTHLVYGCPDVRLGGVVSQLPVMQAYTHPFHTICSVTGGVQGPAAAQLLRDFFREKRQRSK
jgi:tRNA(adenine34) deaminase